LTADEKNFFGVAAMWGMPHFCVSHNSVTCHAWPEGRGRGGIYIFDIVRHFYWEKLVQLACIL